MLALSHPTREVLGVALARDDTEDHVWYVLPPAPRVALRDDQPQVQLLRFVDEGQLTGGHLDLELELAHEGELVEAVRAQLAEEERTEAIELRTVPVIGAEADVVFAGPQTREDGLPGPEILQRLGSAQPRLDAPHRVRFSATLTPDGVRLVEAALRSGGSPIGVFYRLKTEAVRPAQRVVARVDWGRVYDHFSTHKKVGYLFYEEDLRTLTEELVEHKAVQITVVQAVAAEEGESAETGSVDEALAWIQRTIIERYCEPVMPLDRKPARASLGTVGEIFGVGSAFAAKKLTQVERAVAEVDLQRGTVVVRTLVSAAHLADLLGDANPDDHIADAGGDHPFFARVTLQLTTARPLADSHVRAIDGEWVYGSHREPIHLDDANPEVELSAWADSASERRWSLQMELQLAEDAPADPGAQVLVPLLEGEATHRVLDVDGMLELHGVELAITPDPERLMATRAVVLHERGDVELGDRELVLTADQPAATAWFRGHHEGDGLSAQVTHLLSDGRILERDPVPLDTRVFHVAPPFADTMTVQLFSAEDWTDLDRVMVHVDRGPEVPGRTLTFDGPGQFQALALPLTDPLDRTYRYRTQRVWGDGRVEEDVWVETDVPAVLVGRTSPNQLVIDILPLGTAELPVVGIRMIQVKLQYLDPANQVRHIQNFEIRALAHKHRWSVEIADPNLRKYDYQIIVYRTSGDIETGDWTTTGTTQLVVPVVPA